MQKIIGYFNIIWDEAEELQRLAETSDPRVMIDTAGLSPKATRLANVLAAAIVRLPDQCIDALLDEIGRADSQNSGPRSASRSLTSQP